MITNLAKRNSHPNSIMFGDMNLITQDNEKVGGNPLDTNLIDKINNIFNLCQLID